MPLKLPSEEEVTAAEQEFCKRTGLGSQIKRSDIRAALIAASRVNAMRPTESDDERDPTGMLRYYGIINDCHAARDGDCFWSKCPQVRDGEPHKSGRHCPLDVRSVDR